MADSHKRKRSPRTVLSAQVCSTKSIRFTPTDSESDSDTLNSSTVEDDIYISSGSSLDSSVVSSFGKPSSAGDLHADRSMGDAGWSPSDFNYPPNAYIPPMDRSRDVDGTSDDSLNDDADGGIGVNQM